MAETFTPWTDLPLDLWREIFIQALPTSGEQARIDDAPLVLLRVCRDWKKLALETPRLWATINVEIYAGRVRPPLCQISTWLKRSLEAPLHISINQTMQWGIDESNAVRVIELFAPHISRWSTAMFALPTASTVNALVTNSTKIPNQLEALGLAFMQTTYLLSELQTLENLSTLIRAPKMRSLNYDGPFNILTGIDGIQWDRLTELMLANVRRDSPSLSPRLTRPFAGGDPGIEFGHTPTQRHLTFPRPFEVLFGQAEAAYPTRLR
ncbi:hypothetical protein CYLTODRAFT_468446 [Cylindrobasidium torrendii FP15055 ss-10]|uniref:Uncharacterized protein n=1 Tax=Cylindrobasidium torrendii FP15055 ss-10 TaxID=1314674 RepID=A0A0D7BQG3_9AGAR|nr:hypothetical protein CYLTODRAFT_468446 [Cylindrobasidium torrendii FP15055 ss-10]